MDDMDTRYLLSRSLRVATLALVFGAAVLASGRVYQRSSRSVSPEVLASTLDGRIAYRSAIRINGGNGQLTVIDLPGDIRRAAARLRRIGDASHEVFLFEGARLANGVVLESDRVTRLMLIEPAPPEKCILITVEQSYADYSRSRAPPSAHQLSDLPVYPGSQPRRFWYNAASRTSVEMSQTTDQPAAVLAFCREGLRGSGWSHLARETGGTILYTKGRHLCCVAVHAGDGGSNLITVLHKSMDD